MALTNAQKQKDSRNRRNARLDRMETALREISNLEQPRGDTDYDYGCRWGLIKAAKVARAALNPESAA